MTTTQIVEVLTKNPTLDQMRTAFEALRRMLSKTRNPPVDEVIQCGLLNALVQALSVDVKVLVYFVEKIILGREG